MGQHFVSILAMLHIANKKKDPELISRSLYVLVEAVKLRFTGILRVFDTELLIILKNMSENKKDPEGPFLYNYFFNIMKQKH